MRLDNRIVAAQFRRRPWAVVVELEHEFRDRRRIKTRHGILSYILKSQSAIVDGEKKADPGGAATPPIFAALRHDNLHRDL